MISVLIPIYNTDVRKLVTALSLQLEKASIPYEVIMIDDASLPSFQKINKSLKAISSCLYKEHTSNLGRIKTRSELAREAKYPWLLFIDSDCIITNDRFIENYIEQLDKGYDVLVGGTDYLNVKPTSCDYQLHWQYAKKRIATYTTKKRKNIYAGFLFNNVVMKKTIFNDLTFPESIKGYGHEDTWVGIELERNKTWLHILNNTIHHATLDKSSLFLDKNIEALNNIKGLKALAETRTLKKHIKIFRIYHFLEGSKMNGIYSFFIGKLKSKLEKNLLSCHPSLYCFDLLRLYYLNKIMKS